MSPLDLDNLPQFMRTELTRERMAFMRVIAERNELLREVAISGVEYDAGKYVTVQINRETWDALAPWREEPRP